MPPNDCPTSRVLRWRFSHERRVVRCGRQAEDRRRTACSGRSVPRRRTPSDCQRRVRATHRRRLQTMEHRPAMFKERRLVMYEQNPPRDPPFTYGGGASLSSTKSHSTVQDRWRVGTWFKQSVFSRTGIYTREA
ncbi:hypothetical protein BV20DRAFT_660596 [Pilatotrama ljubarskyi]|nr:hypothetical protein BV20DRAFT_660596 [Pilatotrama ljubarskyi]